MRWFRITRYNPAFRDERGAYTRVTWTSVSDVGRTYDDEVLTLGEYERVERSYLDAVRSFAASGGVAARITDPGWDLAGWMLVSGAEDLERAEVHRAQLELREPPNEAGSAP